MNEESVLTIKHWLDIETKISGIQCYFERSSQTKKTIKCRFIGNYESK